MLPKDFSERYVFVALPQCPMCHSTRRKTYRTTPVDGGKSQHSLCLDCGHRFIVVMEVIQPAENEKSKSV
jgi:hypothetical protein